MSHLSQIRLQLKSKYTLEQALKSFNLKHEVVKGIKIGENDLFIPCQQFGVMQETFQKWKQLPGIMFVFTEGEYEMQTDLWAIARDQSTLGHNFPQKLKKEYAKQEILAQAQVMGWNIGGIVEKDGDTVITITAGAASIQCSVNQELAVSLAVNGVQGASCTQLTSQMSSALGMLQQQHLTQDYYLDQYQMQQQQYQIGGGY